MINIDNCLVTCGADGGWSLVDGQNRVQAHLPSGFAASENSAKTLLRLIATHYNRGFGQCSDRVRERLDRILEDLPPDTSTRGKGEDR